MLQPPPRLAATALVAVVAAFLYLRRRRRAASEPVEAYCQPCGDDEQVGSKYHQPALYRSKSALKFKSQGAALSRQSSSVNDDHLAWSTYIEAPSTYAGASGFNAAGAQRIDLPQFAGHEFERVADFIDSEGGSSLGLGALGQFHRLGTAERRAAWRTHFAGLDLGTYEEACQESAQQMAKLCWTVLLIEPHKSFPVHQHPDIEVEFVLRGVLYENRLLAQPNAPLAETAAELAVPDRGYPKLFRVNRHGGGDFFNNPRYSVHQSYTMDEGVVLLVLWTGRHTNITDKEGKLWQAERCQNPECPLACTAKTFRGFVQLGARKKR